MNNSQLLTIIITILVPNMGIWFYLMKHSKELGQIEGVLFKELKNKKENK